MFCLQLSLPDIVPTVLTWRPLLDSLHELAHQTSCNFPMHESCQPAYKQIDIQSESASLKSAKGNRAVRARYRSSGAQASLQGNCHQRSLQLYTWKAFGAATGFPKQTSLGCLTYLWLWMAGVLPGYLMLENLLEATECLRTGKLLKGMTDSGCKATEVAVSNVRIETIISKPCLELGPSLPMRIHGHSDCMVPNLHDMSGSVPCLPTHSLYTARRPHDVNVDGTIVLGGSCRSLIFMRQLRCMS